MKAKGIDVSSYNNVRDYGAVAADGIEFAILKIIRKDLRPDTRFEQHWRGFEGVGMPIQGVYNYSYATTVNKFRADAQRVLEVLAGRNVMVWLDIEDKSLQGLGGKLTDGIRAYSEVIRGAGLPFGIYTYQSFYKSYLQPYADILPFPYWMARYPSSAALTPDKEPNAAKRPDIARPLYGWQYSSKGQIKGIDGYVDLNEWYMEIEALENVPKEPADSYITDGFRRELAVTLGLPEGASANEVLVRTVTVSSRFNRYHASVTPLERLLREYGFYAGEIEEDLGKRPNFGSGMTKATKLYQAQVTRLKKPDAEWTAKNRSYQKALRIN